jgi:hypothetical protein
VTTSDPDTISQPAWLQYIHDLQNGHNVDKFDEPFEVHDNLDIPKVAPLLMHHASVSYGREFLNVFVSDSAYLFNL